MKKQLLLILFSFAFALKAQTINTKTPYPDGDDKNIPTIEKLQVYVANHKINFSIPKELFGKENLALDLYDSNKKLISTNCMECCRFIDVSNLTSGNYLYVIKSGKQNLQSGKLFLN